MNLNITQTRYYKFFSDLKTSCDTNTPFRRVEFSADHNVTKSAVTTCVRFGLISAADNRQVTTYTWSGPGVVDIQFVLNMKDIILGWHKLNYKKLPLAEVRAMLDRPIPEHVMCVINKSKTSVPATAAVPATQPDPAPAPTLSTSQTVEFAPPTLSSPPQRLRAVEEKLDRVLAELAQLKAMWS